MIAVDTNILVYTHRIDLPLHRKAKTAVESLRTHRSRWSIPWPCIHEFIAVVSNPRIFAEPTPVPVAFKTIETLGQNGNLELLAESDGYWDRLQAVALMGKITGPKIHDARIAALCLHHGISELWTADRDFTAFPELKTRNPLTDK
jgi:uncharacterized protein